MMLNDECSPNIHPFIVTDVPLTHINFAVAVVTHFLGHCKGIK